MTSKKRVIVAVTNDLTTDQRVDRVCTTLVKTGFDVLLVGRKRKISLSLNERAYKTKRLRLYFEKGPQFYAEYNIKLFLFLLFKKADILVSNDLDTLLAGYLASVIRHRVLIHDCHEYFRGVPELNNRHLTSMIWKKIEDWIFPRLKNIYAVNSSIADIYSKEYGVHVKVIRNVPATKPVILPKSKSGMGIPGDHRIILYQGAVNIDRGLEEAILSMQYIKIPATLVILGIGDVFNELKNLVLEKNLSGRVLFTGQIPLEELPAYTAIADIGLSIEKDVSLNYHYCLPNKFLDYIQANIPVLVSPLPEMKTIVDKYKIGEMIESHDPLYLAQKIESMLSDREKISIYRKNLLQASADLCWEKEEPELIKIFQPYA